MQEVVAVAILSIGVVFLTLTLLIVLNKAWRETRACHSSMRRAS